MTDLVDSELFSEALGEQLGALLSNGGSIGLALGYDAQDYELLYAVGHSAYEHARYDDAVMVFNYLVMIQPVESRYLSALASSLQMSGDYEEAMNYYSIVSELDLTDPMPTFRTCECLIALGMKQEAHEGLQIVIGQCGDEGLSELRMRAMALIETLDNTQSWKPE